MILTSNFYQKALYCLAGLFVGAIGMAYTVGRNVITKDDLKNQMPALIAEYSPYTQDAKAIAVELGTLKESVELNTSMHTEQYQHIEDQITQIQTDLARVAAKSGVTAHPGPNDR